MYIYIYILCNIYIYIYIYISIYNIKYKIYNIPCTHHKAIRTRRMSRPGCGWVAWVDRPGWVAQRGSPSVGRPGWVAQDGSLRVSRPGLAAQGGSLATYPGIPRQTSRQTDKQRNA